MTLTRNILDRLIRRKIPHWSGIYAYLNAAKKACCVVFYAEDQNAWPHYQGLIEGLKPLINGPVFYFTSQKSDPVLEQNDPYLQTHCVGNGAALTILFQLFRNSLVIMTTPDLDSFHLKRSKLPNVHYAYIHHSPVSMHVSYLKDAFKAFDSIFCVGKHHVEEARALEKTYNHKKKLLIPHGYSKMDELNLAYKKAQLAENFAKRDRPTILLAPSWGDSSLLEAHGKVLLNTLIDAGYTTIVRPHPMTIRRKPELLRSLEALPRKHARVIFENHVTSIDSLLEADLMISDWSGVAIEFSLGCQKPVLYIDLPRKVRNNDWKSVNEVPMFATLRTYLGTVIPINRLSDLPTIITETISQTFDQKQRQNLLDRYFYNHGSCDIAGAKALYEIFTSLKKSFSIE